MIEGIEVLSQTPIMSDGGVGIIVAIFIGIIGFTAGVIYTCYTREEFFAVIIFLISFGIALMAGGITHAISNKPTGRYEYKVIIDDSININDFYKNYDVIDQDGKIYIIQDREIEDDATP